MSKASKWIVWAFVAASFVVPGVVAAAQQDTGSASPAASEAVDEASVDPTGDELVLNPSFNSCSDPCFNTIQCRQRCLDETVICVQRSAGKFCIFPD